MTQERHREPSIVISTGIGRKANYAEHVLTSSFMAARVSVCDYVTQKFTPQAIANHLEQAYKTCEREAQALAQDFQAGKGECTLSP